MKKLLVLALICLAAVCRMNGANKISIPDIYIQKGATATFAVNYEYETANAIQLFGFDLELPDGLTFSSDCLMDNANQGFSLQSNTSGSTVNIAFQPKESGNVLSGTSGTVAYLTLKAASTLTVNELTVNVTNVSVVVDNGNGDESIPLSDTSFKVTIGDRTLLDENSTVVPDEDDDIDVCVHRTINADNWSTICLPFTMSETQVKEAFGTDVKLAEFASAVFTEQDGAVVEITMNFTPVTQITKHRPCIIKVSSPVTYFNVDEVTIEGTDNTPSYKVTGGTFYGVYAANKTIAKNRLFISGGKFWYSNNDSKAISKAFRGNFKLEKELSDMSASRIGLNVDGEVTYINSLDAEMTDGEYYDLQGRRVNNPHKGLYIQNGKKVFVK